MDFCLLAYRFSFQTLDPVRFAPGAAGNIFRGAFGTIFRRLACVPSCPGAKICDLRDRCAYARMFEPSGTAGPSGLADPPRPFVIRACAWDGRTIPAGSEFSIDVHDFDLREPALRWLVLSFVELAAEGLGAGRGRVLLRQVETRRIRIPLDPHPAAIKQLTVRFLTPTELKSEGRPIREPAFAVLFARIRDRISALRRLYGEGPLQIDFRGMTARASQIRLQHCDLKWSAGTRRSSRTGQVHPLAGFTGEVRYEGDLAEFVPYLQAARWTGVGRQTVWGKGEIETVI